MPAGGVTEILVMCPRVCEQPFPLKLHMKLALIGQAELEKKSIESSGWRMDGQADNWPWL